MKFLILLFVGVLVLSTTGFANHSFAEKGTFVDTVKYIQYLEESTALEEVRNGNLDLYYFRMPSDRLESVESRENLKVYESKGGSYSLLVNPAVSDEKFNPFSIKEIRFALNYLVDRKLIVNELMAGYGVPMISNYGPFDPEFMAIIPQVESFDFKYNPILADSIISESLNKAGATKIEDAWYHNDKPIEITVFIRSDDPTRKAIGEIISSELQKIGFKIKKEFGDLNKTFTIVYGSDPAALKWNIYTEGWAGRSVFLRYDPVGLAHMYSPWFSNMPGFNNPGYWNYKHDKLDELTQKIYTGEFDSAKNRDELIAEATTLGISEAIRVFLATKTDQYVVNQNVQGIINDFGAGVPTRFTPINSKTDSGELIIGVKQIYQGAWNPVMGFTDAYSNQIWNTLYDPDTFKDPFSGKAIPIRASWDVTTAGPEGTISVSDSAIIWNPQSQTWENVLPETTATSKVTFDYTFGNWHHGEKMNIKDILYSLYFALEWGSPPLDDDKTFDTEFTPRAAQLVDTIVGMVPVDEDTIEVYVNYWHFDDGEIAAWASLWSTTPWEVTAAMEQLVIDGKVSFSRSGATAKSIPWLSLLIPNDSHLIQEYLKNFKESQFVPRPLDDYYFDSKSAQSRYDAAIQWIDNNNHAVISNGPFYLVGYSPESRTITTAAAFTDEYYPYHAGTWSKYEKVDAPEITGIQMPDLIVKGEKLDIPITTNHSTKLYYFISDGKGNQIASGVDNIITDGMVVVSLSEEQTDTFDVGAGNLKLFVVSEDVLRPDYYNMAFLVTDEFSKIPTAEIDSSQIGLQDESDFTGMGIFVFIIIAVIIGVIIYRRTKSEISRDNTV